MGGSWIPMYLHDQDVKTLVEYIDQDEELAWLVPSGGRCWQAQSSHRAPLVARSVLWHVPSGPLPLVLPRFPGESFGAEREWIDDPWGGWRERRTGADPSTPYFGPGWPGTYGLNLRPRDEHGEIGISSFEWIGNRYAVLGERADPATERHWRRLRQWVRTHSRKITRSGPASPSSAQAEVFALPAALAAIEAGASRALNPRPDWPWTEIDAP